LFPSWIWNIWSVLSLLQPGNCTKNWKFQHEEHYVKRTRNYFRFQWSYWDSKKHLEWAFILRRSFKLNWVENLRVLPRLQRSYFANSRKISQGLIKHISTEWEEASWRYIKRKGIVTQNRRSQRLVLCGEKVCDLSWWSDF
jgi:hypothetical protein